jgi:hypothetical protein
LKIIKKVCWNILSHDLIVKKRLRIYFMGWTSVWAVDGVFMGNWSLGEF